jgi:phosphoenolpyruvate carboxylase
MGLPKYVTTTSRCLALTAAVLQIAQELLQIELQKASKSFIEVHEVYYRELQAVRPHLQSTSTYVRGSTSWFEARNGTSDAKKCKPMACS